MFSKSLLKKTDKDGEFDVDGEDVARVAKTLGINILSQTQGYQLQYRGKFSVISVWMVPGINLDRFCKDINIRGTDNVMTGIIRPSDVLTMLLTQSVSQSANI